MSLLSSSDIAAVQATLREVSNATLTAVRGAGTKDRYGEETGQGSTLWSGSVPAFLDREQALGLDAPQAERPSRGRYTDRSTLTILDADASAAVSDLLSPPWEHTRIDVTAESVAATFRVVDVVHDASATLGSVTLILVPEPVVA